MRPIGVGVLRGGRKEREGWERTDVRISRDPAPIDDMSLLRRPVRSISQPSLKHLLLNPLPQKSTLTSSASHSAPAAKSSTPH